MSPLPSSPTPNDHSAKWVGYELHDGLLQWLVAARMQLDAGGKREEIERCIVASIEEGRSLITFLEQHGDRKTSELDTAIGEYLEFVPHAEDVCIQWQSEGRPTLTPSDSWNILRIAQQAVRNALHHGRASHVRVSLSRVESAWALRVEDDGCGFHPPEDASGLIADNHFGIASMHHRASQIGAQLTIDSQPGAGCRIELVFSADPA